MYLRSGDVIPSEVSRIDENGVTFRTSLSASTFVPHDKVQAVELAQPGDVTIKVTKAKRERLLTLPRMQKDNPPTHLIRSRNGDYIRGRLIKLDDKALEVEIRLEPRDHCPRPAGLDRLAPSRTSPARREASADGRSGRMRPGSRPSATMESV